MEEEKKQQSQHEEKEQDKKKYTLKVVITTVIATLLLIAILLLCVLFGLKNCSGHSKENTSSELPIDSTRNSNIANVLREIVRKQMVVDGYDEDNLATVESVTYKDNYPSTFDLGITIRSESNKIYTYSIDNCFYPINKE